MKKIIVVGLIMLHSACKPIQEAGPNIVWLITEDTSPQHMQLYYEGGVSMPNIEKLAKQGIVYNNCLLYTSPSPRDRQEIECLV